MKLKCITFDIDGTMADTERGGHRVAFNLALAIYPNFSEINTQSLTQLLGEDHV